MAWLEYLLPLIFLFPMAAMASIVLALRSLHDARVHSLLTRLFTNQAKHCGTALTKRFPAYF